MIIQVSDVIAENKGRELEGCRAAMRDLHLKESYIVTNDEFYADSSEFDEGVIHVIPAWRFSLNLDNIIRPALK